MKKYIVYRYFDNVLFYTYERVELTEKELKDYLYEHQTELKNIEVFKEEGKCKVEMQVDITLK